MLRRNFLLGSAAAPSLLRGAALDPKRRVDRALAGKDVDRPPFSFWHHFGLKTADAHADRTLQFHRAHRTDIVKVMSDFPFPKPEGSWHMVKLLDNPFPDQIRALELIRDGLGGSAYFVETLFNPWNVAEKLSSPAEVLRLKAEQPQALLDALDAITESEIRHARRALDLGAAGIFLSVANAQSKLLSPEDYAKFSRPFDKRILDAVGGAKLNVLHLHGIEPEYTTHFRDFRAPVVNYSVHVSGIPIPEMRRLFRGAIAAGIDEVHYRTLSPDQLRAQWKTAAIAAGKRFIVAPGCSVPDDSTPGELAKLPSILGT